MDNSQNTKLRGSQVCLSSNVLQWGMDGDREGNDVLKTALLTFDKLRLVSPNFVEAWLDKMGRETSLSEAELLEPFALEMRRVVPFIALTTLDPLMIISRPI